MKFKTLTIIALLVILIFVAFRIAAIFMVPFVGDEPNDIGIILGDISGFLNFYSSPQAYEFDQARFPLLISTPLVILAGIKAIIPLRLLFFIFNLLYLFISFKLINLLTTNKMAAWIYVVLLASSCYLSSFSVFTMSSGGNLFLLFHILTTYFFIRGYLELKRTGRFPSFLLFTLLLALCISSKLFGLLLLVSLIVFHFLFGNKKIYINSPPPKIMFALGIFFLVNILLINIVPLDAVQKLIFSSVFALAYLVLILFFAVRENNQKYQKIKVDFFEFWSVIVLTAFNLTLIFSPVYLNLNNILKAFDWFNNWNQGLIISGSNYYDIFLIMLMKYGLPSSFILIIACFVYFAVRLRDKDKNIGNFLVVLFFLIFIVQFIAISLVGFKVAWYPLAIFPFLYLPLVFLWELAVRKHSKKLLLVSLLFLSIVFIDNAARYFYWFPYGHFDGAQYGREYIGWNRAGFITFEIFPEVIKSLDTISSQRDPNGPVFIGCHVVNVPRYNQAVAYYLRNYYPSKNGYNYFFTAQGFDPNDQVDYLLTSPVYYPEFEETLKGRNFIMLSTLLIKGIPIASIWQKEI